MPRGDRLREVLAFAAIYLIWGSTYLAIAITVETIPPVFMVALRGALAGGVLLLILRWRGGAPVTWREVWSAVPAAAFLFGGGYVLVGWSAQHLDSSVAALLNATVPAFVVLIETSTGRRAWPGPPVWGALVAGLMGVGILVLGRGAGCEGVAPWPAAVMLLASFSWAYGSVRYGRSGGGDPMRRAAVQLVTGALLLLPVSGLLGEFNVLLRGEAGLHSLFALSYLVIFGSLVGFSAYVWLLQHVPAGKASSHAYVNPLVAVLLGGWLGHERLDGATALAAALIAASVVAIVRAESRVDGQQPRLARPIAGRLRKAWARAG